MDVLWISIGLAAAWGAAALVARLRGDARGGLRTTSMVLVTVATHLNTEGHMVSYGTARDSLVGELLKDAMAHEAGHYQEIGRHFEGIERQMPRGAARQLTRLHVALSFWDGWIDARDHGWLAGGNIAKGEWPMLARRIASDLSHDLEISDARVGARFDASAAGAAAAGAAAAGA